MDLSALTKPLTVDQIEFRVQSVNKGGYATILAYKDARCDMNRLDEVVGPLNWRREHLHNNNNCVVSIYDESKAEWVPKEDTGTASNTEAQKGLASDSFKRACFNWGIGRELYDYPQIQIKLNQDEFTVNGDKAKQTYKLKLKEWRWKSAFDGHRIVSLAAQDTKGVIRFSWVDGEHERLVGSLVGLYQSGDSEGLATAFESLQEDEDKMDAVWRTLDAKTRREMKEMLTNERKAQKEESQ